MRKTSGLSLLLLIFLSLCLITFSLLSVSEATADRTLSAKSAARTTEYYAAATKANQILSDIDAQLAAFLEEAERSEDASETYAALCSSIGSTISDAAWNENHTISFSVPVNETQQLQAALSITYPENAEDTLYQIIEWCIVNTKEWHPDTSQKLFRTDMQ